MTAVISRRDLIKGHAAALAAASAGIALPASAQPVAGGLEALEIKWSKAPCRFCGTGCGVMVGVKEGLLVFLVVELGDSGGVCLGLGLGLVLFVFGIVVAQDEFVGDGVRVAAEVGTALFHAQRGRPRVVGDSGAAVP